MTDDDRKNLYRWFDVRIKRLIQIGGTDSNYIISDGEVSVMIRFVTDHFPQLVIPPNLTAWVDIQDKMRGMFEGYGRIHGRGYIDNRAYAWVATYEERLS